MGADKALVVFGSSTGTTRILARAVRKGLESAGLSVEVRNASRTRPGDLVGFPVVLAGCSTWEDGRLQSDFRRLLSELGPLRLDGVAAGVFGPGSRAYPLFCRAVDVLQGDLLDRGARLVLPPFRVDGSAYPVRAAAAAWAGGIRRFL